MRSYQGYIYPQGINGDLNLIPWLICVCQVFPPWSYHFLLSKLCSMEVSKSPKPVYPQSELNFTSWAEECLKFFCKDLSFLSHLLSHLYQYRLTDIYFIFGVTIPYSFILISLWHGHTNVGFCFLFLSVSLPSGTTRCSRLTYFLPQS